MGKFTEATHTGLHLEHIQGARDPRVRTIRSTTSSGGVLRAPVRGDTYLLVDVRPHDEPNRLARRVAFKANTATGAIQVWDVESRNSTTP